VWCLNERVTYLLERKPTVRDVMCCVLRSTCRCLRSATRCGALALRVCKRLTWCRQKTAYEYILRWELHTLYYTSTHVLEFNTVAASNQLCVLPKSVSLLLLTI